MRRCTCGNFTSMVSVTTRSLSSTNTAAGSSVRTSRIRCDTKNRGRCKLPNIGITTEDNAGKGVARPPYGMGFDLGYSDNIREGLRKVIEDSASYPPAEINLDPLRDAINFTYRQDDRWTVFQCIENHDLLDDNHSGRDKQPRIARLSDPSDARSWYARSRSKVATGLLLTAPGVPMIFMGQEFLEDKYWTDYPKKPELLIWWDGLDGKDRHMSDQHRFTRELMW